MIGYGFLVIGLHNSPGWINHTSMSDFNAQLLLEYSWVQGPGYKMGPICSTNRTLRISYRQAQAPSCLICIIPCSAFSFFLNKEQYKEWQLKFRVMLSGRIIDLFCTKMPVLLVCLLHLLHGRAVVRALETKPQLWACFWVLGREIFSLSCFYQGGRSMHPTHPHK